MGFKREDSQEVARHWSGTSKKYLHVMPLRSFLINVCPDEFYWTQDLIFVHSSLGLYMHPLIHYCMCVREAHAMAHKWRSRGQLCGVDSLLPPLPDLGDLNSGGVVTELRLA